MSDYLNYMDDEQQKFIKNHQAIWQQQGFDYQYAVFVCILMKGNLHDSVSYEDADDIVVETENGKTKLIQVKHSFEGGNLTNSSDELWKTLNNWYDWVYKYKAGNKDLNDITFHIVTNKKVTNELLLKINDIRNGAANSNDLKSVVKRMSNLKNAKAICEKLLNNEEKMLPLLMKIEFRELVDPYKEMCQELVRRSFQGFPIEQALTEIIGIMEQKKMSFKGEKIKLTAEDFNRFCQDVLQRQRLHPFSPLELDDKEIPQDYLSSNMVKQLLSIKLIRDKNNRNDKELLHAYHNYWCYQNSIDLWSVQNHYLTDMSIYKLNEKFKDEWGVIFQRSYRKCDYSEESIVDCGYQCYTDTMDKEIRLNEIFIPVPFSSGWYLNLSNEENPSVYWREDWKKYGENE